MIITFAGHSFVRSKDKVKELVKEQILNIIIDAKNTTCYLGGYGDFDDICAIACRELKREHHCIEIVYVTPYINLSEQEKINQLQSFGLYDSSIYPPLKKTPPKFVISKRNEWMITQADIIIAYINHDYGGEYKSIKIAKRQNKKIINICDLNKN